jgi:hypothetical protein
MKQLVSLIRATVLNYSPDPCWISRNKAFRKGYDLRTVDSSFFHESANFLNRCVEIEPFRLGLRNGNTNCRGFELHIHYDLFMMAIAQVSLKNQDIRKDGERLQPLNEEIIWRKATM